MPARATTRASTPICCWALTSSRVRRGVAVRGLVGGVVNNDGVTETAQDRKARGAFFTPDAITAYLTQWAVRSDADRVFEPSAGDAAFLVAAIRRLQALGVDHPTVDGVEIHAASAASARRRVADAGGRARIRTANFFAVDPRPEYTAVIGNPPTSAIRISAVRHAPSRGVRRFARA